MFVEQLLQLGTIFGVGLYVATSPCIFPLLPLFLIRSLQAEETRRGSLAVTMALTLGILVSLAVFIALVTIIWGFGLAMINLYEPLNAALGVLIIFLGFVTMSHKLRDVLRISRLSMREPGDPKGLGGVFVAGLGYSLLAAPCTAPVLLSTPFLFAYLTDFFMIILMFIALAMAVSIPYLIIALATGEARLRVASQMAANAHKLEIVVGMLLIVLGIWLMLPWISTVLTS